MEQTRSQTPIRAADATLRHPGRAAAAVPGRSAAGTALPPARGEHTRGRPAHEGRTRDDHPPAGHPDGGRTSPGAPPPGGPTAAGRVSPQRHSVRDQVLAALREALLCGELAPGEVYSAPALAGRYGVSPTPVREAMQRLASEGLVETVPNRGFRVTEHTARDAAELAEVRALLEIPTVLALARTLPAERWEELRPLAEATVAAAARGDRTAYVAADRAFHLALLEPHGNRRLARVAEDVLRHAQCPVTGAGAARVPAARLVAAAAEHVALLDALQSRDPASVERILRTHLAAR